MTTRTVTAVMKDIKRRENNGESNLDHIELLVELREAVGNADSVVAYGQMLSLDPDRFLK